MGLIARIARRSPKARLLRSFIVLTLSVGAVGMALPFGMMLSGATRTGVDRSDFRLVPRFLTDERALMVKYLEGLYNESPAVMRASWESEARDFGDVGGEEEEEEGEVERWRRFLKENSMEPEGRHVGFVYAPTSRSRPWNVRGFLRSVHREYRGDLEAANRALGSSIGSWNGFQVLPPDTRSRLGLEPDTAWWRRWGRYVEEEAPRWSVSVHNLQGYFHERITVPLLGREAGRMELTERVPEDAEQARLWLVFVREAVHPGFVRFDREMTGLWREYLKARYVDVGTLGELTGVKVAGFEGLEVPGSWREAGPLGADWCALLEGWRSPASGETYQAPAGQLRLESPDVRWRGKTGRRPPIAAEVLRTFEENKEAIRRAFVWQHFGTVWEILILHGRGLGNTLVYCVASVGIALIVNPLAAYALSRFRPRHTYGLLLYLLLTMAFPPMVTQIPVFLLLRDLGLLNSFAALLLPGMAHGYSIFLLKGFFDSLPRDLYESAALDGAGEIRMFGVITLSLSKPILAVIALGAFVNAYTAFMFALLICQDERMWTLMVWLHQLQQSYGPGVMNAAFVLAALPTLVVFLVAQRQILRGIIVPSEK